MRLPRAVGVVDIAVGLILLIAALMPPREMYAATVVKADDAHQFALALAEARTIANPGDGAAVEDFARKLGEADQKDWAVEAARRASEQAKASPTRWRALLATSVAYVDLLDVVPALDYANRALAACDAARAKGDQAACPSWEEIRMQLYQQHLDAGVKSGIDPKKGAKAIAAFRRAGEAGLREIHIVSGHQAPTAPASGSGSAGSGSATTAP